MEGHLEVASLLLSRCAKHISFKCAVGRTSLHFAAANGHLDLVQLLLTQGSDINDQDSVRFSYFFRSIFKCFSVDVSHQ